MLKCNRSTPPTIRAPYEPRTLHVLGSLCAFVLGLLGLWLIFAPEAAFSVLSATLPLSGPLLAAMIGLTLLRLLRLRC